MKKLAVALTVFAVSALIPAFASQSTEPITGTVETNQTSVPDEQNSSLPEPTQVAMAPTLAAPAQAKLNLSDEQLEKINTLKNQLADAAGPKRLELKKQKRLLHDLMTQSSVDKSKVTAVQSKINSLHDDLTNMFLSFKLDSLDVMNADQRGQLRHKFLKHELGHGRHGSHKAHDQGLKSS